MENFREETLETLEENGKTIDDIKWVGNSRGFIPVQQFFDEINFDYDSGFGGAEIEGLYIIGYDFYMYRAEYDGAEWWNYVPFSIFEKPEKEMESHIICFRQEREDG